MRVWKGWHLLALAVLCAVLAVGPALPTAAGAAEEPVQKITGHVNLPGDYAADAVVVANAFAYVEESPGVFIWSVVESSEVASDGTYAIDVEPGTYRVGFFDSNNVYKDAYFAGATSVQSATPVDVAANTVVPNIDTTLTAHPELIVQGNVHTSGAPASESGFGVQVWQLVTAEGVTEWQPTLSANTKADGSYRVHLLNSGPFKLKFIDYDDVFAPVFHQDAADHESAGELSVTTTGTPLAGIDQTMTLRPSTRIEGSNRYTAAAELSKSAFEDGKGGTIVIASGENWAEGAAASSYAYAKDGPLLYVNKLGIPAVTKTEILRLAPTEAVIVGNYGSIPLSVGRALRKMGIPIVRRIDGADRYEIAADIARELVNTGGVEGGKAMIVSGESCWGAVAAAPVAAAGQMPVLLVRRNSVPAATAEVIEELGLDTTVIVGNTTTISSTVARQLPGVTRLSGGSPYTAAAAVAGYGIDELGLNARTVGLVRGDHFANGLAAGPILARSRQVMLFTQPNTLSTTTRGFLTARKNTIARIVAVGGTNTLSDGTFTAAQNALK
ncbi:MAG: cell wall-binding repeat-containing protein [Coriobacteriales bacterium]|nr:cell wall-binding repeat-containing protein [Coriobacteriales bacterium]